jgi:GTPase
MHVRSFPLPQIVPANQHVLLHSVTTHQRQRWFSLSFCSQEQRLLHVYSATRNDDDSDNNIDSNVHDVASSTTATTTDAVPQDVLLQQLDDSFVYDGRLMRGDVLQHRCGYVCILGAPNMGKSTLLNALLQEDLCICTSRPQTTRHAILGILSTNTTQVCFIDTPGVLETPAYKLQEGMMEAVTTAFRDADVLLVVTDLFSTPIPNDQLFTRVQQSKKPVIVVVNKIDLVATKRASTMTTTAATHRSTSNKNQQHEVPTLPNENSNCIEMDTSSKTYTVDEAVAMWRQLLPNALLIVPTCAQNGPFDSGVVTIRRLLCGGPQISAAIRSLGRPIPGMFAATNMTINDPMWNNDETIRSSLLPLSPPLYDTDTYTDRTERFVASEIIRAAIFTSFHKELPYCCEVQITSYKESSATTTTTTTKSSTSGSSDRAAAAAAAKVPSMRSNIIRISADIIVERDSQKAIVIGKNGEQIKQVGMVAREKLQVFLQEQVPYTRPYSMCRLFFLLTVKVVPRFLVFSHHSTIKFLAQVHLTLNVKVNKDWRKKEDQLKLYGYLSK